MASLSAAEIEHYRCEGWLIPQFRVYMIHGAKANTSAQRRTGVALRYMPATLRKSQVGTPCRAYIARTPETSMLAAQSAWTILRAEHAQLRRRLDSIAEALRGVQWSEPDQAVPRLRQQIESLHAFDLDAHRPKGFALMGVLRGRSPDADRLLDVLEQEREDNDALLVRSLGLLDAIAAGDPSAGTECAAVLARHRERMMRHLDQEDTLLCAHSERLLTDEEWSRVVSAISSALY